MRILKYSTLAAILLTTTAHAVENFDPLGLWSGGVVEDNKSSNAKPALNQGNIDYSQYAAPSKDISDEQLNIKIKQMASKDKPVDPRSYNALKNYSPRADTSLALADASVARSAMEQESNRLSGNTRTSGVFIPEGPTLKPGAQSQRVELLSQGLINLGYLSGKPTRKYTKNVGTALKQFQADSGLTADGFAGKNTIDIINGHGNFRKKAIDFTLRQGEQRIPRDSKAIVVNIASQSLRGYENGELVLTSRVIVGKEKYFTPEFKDTIDSITINPIWNVPKGISERSYRGKKVAVTAGPDNPLGKLRFNMYNPHTIYLHHTNSPSLFDRSRRTFSSGCIRVQKAYDLAQWLAGSKFNTFGGGFNTVLTTNTERTLKMTHPIPVYIEYRPAEVLANGKIQIWNDPYGRIK
ncbi:MAG: L,D-transpeptidase family protein [Alphaproteobacteria bacterium]